MTESINLVLLNNTNLPQPINIMGVTTPQGFANNANQLFEYDLSSEDLSMLTSVSIGVATTDNPTYVTYTAPVQSSTISGIVEALNTLNVGIFLYSGTLIYVSSSYYIYGNVNVSVSTSSFVSTWNTANTRGGGSNADQIQLPLGSTGTYNFTVDWGDGTTDTITSYNQAETLHTYASSGTYTLTIDGIIEGFSFYDYYQESLKIISVDTWGVFRLVDSVNGGYFNSCENLDLSLVSDILDLTGITNLEIMFNSCTSLTSINNVNFWNVSNVINMAYMFSGATLFNANISAWNVSSVTDMTEMFYATSFNQPIGSWNVSNVTDMSYMFQQTSVFNQPLNSWNVNSVTNMNSMFYEATAFNQPLNSWDVSSVTNMNSMFGSATSFNQPLNSWNVSSVTDMNNMFQGATLFNQPLDSWDVSSVAGMSGMFSYTTDFNQPLNSWNVSGVTNMDSMFRQATSFNQPLNLWDVSSVTNMGAMYSLAISFNGDISSWDVSSVADMNGMFNGAISFNQSIGSWNVINVTNLLSFMNGKSTADYSSAYLDAIYNSWSLLTLQPNVPANFGTIQYTVAGSAGRAILTGAPNNWSITDGGVI